ncbi:MAG TPA: ABC transporter ATP-binding protein [Beutenbergiaceae bacterium]|nr:ABC transporter ATP-binding protein [Beutenbergiaceae bacterium]
MHSSSSVELTDVRRRFGHTQALAGVDFSARSGQVTAVLGPNGAGKTTMLEICEGLQRADSGTVRVLGLDPIRDASRLRPRVGVMIQDGGLPAAARAGELLRHVSRMYARPENVAELSERLQLTSFAKTQVRHLSGGMRQRLAMGIALVGRPDVVFLDEPSAGLDPAARRDVWQIIDDVRARGTTIILTSHLMDEVEHLADEVYIMDSGRILAHGTVADLVSLEAAPAAATTSVKVSGTLGNADFLELQDWAGRRGLTVSRRSLEDVFLDLTGRTLQ